MLIPAKHRVEKRSRNRSTEIESTMGSQRDDVQMESLGDVLRAFHRDESGVAMTEYIIVFSLISLGSTISVLVTAAYVKGYRDFLVWWLGHPAV